jgi:hypothetical protein
MRRAKPSNAPSFDSRIIVFLVGRVAEMVRAVNEQGQSFLPACAPVIGSGY